MKHYLKDYSRLFTIAGVIIIIDQWTKALVRNNLPEGGSWSPWSWLAPYARIVHWYNTGAAFGIFQNRGIVFAALAIVVSILIIFYYPRTQSSDWVLRLAMSMQLGGAVGNLLDRLTLGFKVTDFISVGSFAVFNVADSCITLSVAVLLIGTWIKDRTTRRDQKSENTRKVALDQSTSGQGVSQDDVRSG